MRHRRRYSLALIVILAVLVGATSADATCTLSITDITSVTWRGKRGRGYDVYERQQKAEPVNMRIKSVGACPFFVTVSAQSATGGGPGSLRGPGAALRYYIFRDPNSMQELKPRNLASSSDVLTGTAPKGTNTTSFQFALYIPADQIVIPGGYQDQLEISAYEGTLQQATLRDRRQVPVLAPVASVAEVSFAQGGGFDANLGSYSLNFNNMRTGDIGSVILRARGNGGYRIGFQSTYGAMRHVSGDGTVRYTLSVDGAPADLPQGATVQLITNSNPTPPDGEDYRLEFEIGDISGAPAGDYRDIINLTVFSLR